MKPGRERLSWEELEESARRDLDELQLRLETAPWWVIEQDELRSEESRLIQILMKCEIALGRLNGNNGESDRRRDAV